MTHVATGVVVTATEDRSQHRNRAVAQERLEAALSERAELAARAAVDGARAATFDAFREFTWTSWRDEVRGPAGRRASMRRALSGKLAPLLAD